MLKLRAFEWVVGVGLMCLTLTHWQPMGIHLFELLSAFPHFTIGISLILGVIALVLKRWVLLAAAFIGITLNTLLILSAPVIAPDPDVAPDIKIAQLNLYAESLLEPDLAIDDLKDMDVLSLQELNVNLHDNLLLSLEKVFPYRCENLWDTCCYGIGLYSKWPILKCEDIGQFGVPIIQAEFLIDGRSVNIISLHTVPPAFPDRTEERNIQLHFITERAYGISGLCIVLGDFNLVPWDSEFSRFLENGKLASVRDGFQATYPMDYGFPLIPIDHICFSGHFIPTECRTVVIPGSDHKGMVASLAFKDR